MAVKFRALNQSDKSKIGKVISSADRLDNFAAFQYSDVTTNSYMSNSSSSHVRGIIDLILPTFNYVLGASGMSTLRRILGVSSDTWNSIVNYQKVYDKTCEELVEPNQTYRLSDVLIGPMYVKKLIDDFNVQQTIYRLLVDSILEKSKKKTNEFFDITTTPTGILLLDKYYLKITDTNEFYDRLTCKVNLGAVVRQVRESVIESIDSKTSLTYYNNTALRNCINRIVSDALYTATPAENYSSPQVPSIMDSMFNKILTDLTYPNSAEAGELLSKYPDIVSVVTSIVNDYLQIPNKANYYNGVGNKLTLNILLEYVRDSLLNSSESRMSYLLAINDQSKEELYGMLNYYIVVLPQALHPRIEGREHKITRLYANVMNANTELSLIYNPNARPSDVILRYQMLDSAVSKLQYKNVELGMANTAKDDKSILERVKSKKGHIRKLLLGKRQDYSGRAVVCINPYLPLDTIRIPRSMIVNLLTYHLLPILATTMDDNTNINKLTKSYLENPKNQNELLRLINEKGLLDNVTMYMGRQPTLHKQSLQGFFIEESNLNAIEVNPLVCPAFNMDFDGDQAHIEVPLSNEAINEVRTKLLTTKNLFLSKTGECTTEPRQDMLMGLYICTRKTYSIQTPNPTNFVTAEQVKQAIFKHTIKVWDTVNCAEYGGAFLAGDLAVAACFKPGDLQPRSSADITAENSKNFKPSNQIPYTVVEWNKKTVGYYMDIILRFGSNGDTVYSLGQKKAPRDSIVGVINRLVELGFKVARLYSPNISLLQPMHDVPFTLNEKHSDGTVETVNFPYSKTQQHFYESMATTTLYYNYGLETLDNYSIVFDEAFKNINDLYSKNIFNVIEDSNGFSVMAKSGGRGSADNLVQMFACKGKVKKNTTESFNALLEDSYYTQLTPMEHFVEAYGGRQGLIDKSLKTGDTGYLMRQMWHTAQAFRITCEDCGTKEGLEISKDYLAKMSSIDTASGSEDKLRDEVKSVFKHFITGRYLVGASKPITAQEAAVLAGEMGSGAVDKITIRSPLTCKNPCCVRCYGIDNATHHVVKEGTYVGVIAAQSIGEPGTQLTMKEFQRGGVASRVDVTSAFDKVRDYVHIKDLSKGYAGYDPLAWGTGEVIETPTKDINMKTIRIKGCGSHSVKVPINTQIKSQAVKGEGLAYVHGDLSIPEILEISGISEAQKYLVHKLFYIYKGEVQISLVHFEILVASMTRHMIISTNRKDLRVGQYCTSQELLRGSIDGTIYQSRLLSTHSITNASLDALDAISMEQQLSGLSRACLLGLTDTLTKPINRILMGKTIL